MKTISILLGFCIVVGSAFAASDNAAAGGSKLKVIQTKALEFPLPLKAKGIRKGQVRAVFHIDSTGKLADYLITAYTNRLFADEVRSAVEHWKFEPEQVNGTPVGSIVELTFDFSLEGLMVINRLNLEYAHVEENENAFEYEARTLKGVDKIPTPVTLVNPAYPKEWSDKGIAGKVVVDFYIDEEGKVRMPAALAGANPDLAGLAVSAVQQWTFTTPQYHGKPALVHVQQTFDFK